MVLLVDGGAAKRLQQIIRCLRLDGVHWCCSLALLTKGSPAGLRNHCGFRCGVRNEVREVALWHLRGLLLLPGPFPGSQLDIIRITGGGGGRKGIHIRRTQGPARRSGNIILGRTAGLYAALERHYVAKRKTLKLFGSPDTYDLARGLALGGQSSSSSLASAEQSG